jgi:hypothetical protein
MKKPNWPRSARGERPRYFADPAVDQIHATVLAMAVEIVALRERLETAEGLLVSRGVLAKGDIDGHVPHREEQSRRAALAEETFKRLFRCVRPEQ